MRLFVVISVLFLAGSLLGDTPAKAQPGESAQSQPYIQHQQQSQSQQTQPQQPPQQILATNRQRFMIPFDLNLPKDTNRDVELILSRDRGVNWHLHSRIGSDKKQFAFESETDGEYWFIIRTVGGDGVARAPEPGRPSMKVLLDTQQPEIELNLNLRPDGEVAVSWIISDLHLSQRFPSVYCSYHLPGGTPEWKPLAIDLRNLRSQGTEHTGELFFRPPAGASHLEIRCEASDMAGNLSSKSAVLALFNQPQAGLANNGIGVNTGDAARNPERVRELEASPLAPPQPRHDRPERKIVDNFSDYNNPNNYGNNHNRNPNSNSNPRTPPRPLNNPYAGSDGFVIPGDAEELEPLRLPDDPEFSPPPSSIEKTENPEKPEIIESADIPGSVRLDNTVPDFRQNPGLNFGRNPAVSNIEDIALSPIPNQGLDSGHNSDIEQNQSQSQNPDLESDPVQWQGPSLGLDLGPLPTVPSNSSNSSQDFTQDSTTNSSNLEISAIPAPELAEMWPKYADAAEILATDPIFAVDPIGFEFGEPALVRIVVPPTMDELDEQVQPRFPGLSQNPYQIPYQAQPQPPPDSAPKISPSPPVGKIEYVSLEANVPLPYIVLEWNTGTYHWAEAILNVYRGPSENGPWDVVAERIDNTGKHSWYVGEADMKPFFVRLEILNPDGQKSGDTTRRSIRIEPNMLGNR